MAKDDIKYLDLDSVDSGLEVVVKLDGVEHKLQQVTVEDFIANTKLLQNMKAEASLEEEVEVVITMLLRAFPTMNREQLRKLSMAKLNAILDFAQKHNGSKDGESEAKSEGNPQTAG